MGRVLAVQPVWTCHRSGDCCQGPDLVVTHAEAEILKAAAVQLGRPDVTFVRYPDPAFVVLRGSPCHFLGADAQGTPTCLVYDVRPYNCRRFACYRDDPTTEPLQRGGPIGCHNALAKMRTSQVIREDYRRREADAKPWGFAHGWPI